LHHHLADGCHPKDTVCCNYVKLMYPPEGSTCNLSRFILCTFDNCTR